MYFWRMKTKRLSPGIPRLHNSSMCSRRIRFTTIANARFSMVIWDSLSSSSHELFGLQHRISKHLLVARFVPFKANPTRVDDRDDDHADHKIHSLN